jgi:AAA15 family ATPase/GTPase
MNVPDLEDREFVVRSVQVDVASTHQVYDGNEIAESCEMPFMQIESTGTIKLFGILPVIFNALENGGVLVIDEIENGLHPVVVKQIIDLFPGLRSEQVQAALSAGFDVTIDTKVSAQALMDIIRS